VHQLFLFIFTNAIITSEQKDMKYVLVTESPENYETDEIAQMEVMDESGSTKICKYPKSKYPLQVDAATGVYTEGRMIVCGGISNFGSTASACYSYEDDQQGWTKLADMDTPRSSSSSIQIPGGIFVTGGHDGSYNILKTSELIHINGTVKQGKLLPEPISGHCMVEYQGEIISTGGEDGNYDDTSDVWSFNNHVEFTLTNKPSMKHARHHHACGIVHSIQHEDRPLLVVAGGYGNGIDKSEYWDFTLPGSQWQLCSKDLPVSMYLGPRMTTTNKNQLLLTYEEGIYSFNCRSSDDCYWEKKNQELKTDRYYHVLMEVPASLVENC